MYCKNCGTQISDDAKFCSNCGAEIIVEAPEVPEAPETPEPPVQTPPPPTSQPVYPASSPQGQASQSSGKAIAALVLGILAILFSGSVALGIILGIVAIVLAGSAVKEAGADGKAKAGKICGIIGIVLSALSLVFFIIMGLVAGLMAVDGNILGDDDVAAIIEELTEQTENELGLPSSSSSAQVPSSSSSAPTVTTSPIVGSWQGNLQSGEPCVYMFNNNGSFLKYVEGEIYNQGLYKTSGNILYLDGDFDQETWEFSVEGNDTLVLSWAPVDATFVFTRID